MKKVSLFLVTLLVASMAIITVSCKKNRETVLDENEQPTTFCPQGEEAINRILDFRKQIEAYRKNPNMKSNATVNLTEAVWDIENLFNLTYAAPEEAYSEVTEFVFSLNFSIDAQGNVLATDLYNLYDQAKATARTYYANTDFAEKGFLFMTVELGEQSGSTARMDFRGKAGERCAQPTWHYHDTAIYMGPFNGTDNWHYADGMGKCDGSVLDSGADKEIERNLRAYLAATAETPETESRAVYVNPIIVEFDGLDKSDYVFYRTNTDATCIDFNNMNRLFQKERRLIFVIIPENPAYGVCGYFPTYIQIDGQFKNNNGVTYITHVNEITYTQRMLANITTVGEIRDLLND